MLSVLDSHEQAPKSLYDKDNFVNIVEKDQITTQYRGPHCKISALSSCMSYYDSHSYPLYKHHKSRPEEVPISVRGIAKSCGSSQGEVTSPAMMNNIAKKLGLSLKFMPFNSRDEMMSIIRDSIDQAKPVILFTQVHDEDLTPSDHVTCSGQQFEHAGTVFGYAKTLESLVVHNARKLVIWNVDDTFRAACRVSQQRSEETFIKFLQIDKWERLLDSPQQGIFDEAGSKTYSHENLSDLINRCAHVARDEPCKYHDASYCLRTGLLSQKLLKGLEQEGMLAIRCSTQEPDGNFHKLLAVVNSDA